MPPWIPSSASVLMISGLFLPTYKKWQIQEKGSKQYVEASKSHIDIFRTPPSDRFLENDWKNMLVENIIVPHNWGLAGFG
jgi:hypothetical protein